MEQIKKIAGYLLLYFYTVQRKRGFDNPEMLNFGRSRDDVMTYSGNDEILKLAEGNQVNLYNAIMYLKGQDFIEVKHETDSGGETFYNLRVSTNGIDIIENIERDEESKNKFTINFNIKLAENINIESLIKNQLSSLFKASLL